MTNQEAINLLYDIRNTMSRWKGQEKHIEALTMAIGALSKEKPYAKLSHGEIVQLEKDKIEQLSAAEPKKGQMERHAKWLHEQLALPLSDGSKECVRCSSCLTHWDNISNYCPNCGADMRGEQDG